jgi:hypothetical protein
MSLAPYLSLVRTRLGYVLKLNALKFYFWTQRCVCSTGNKFQENITKAA